MMAMVIVNIMYVDLQQADAITVMMFAVGQQEQIVYDFIVNRGSKMV